MKKRCAKCRIGKPFNEFSPDKGQLDGHHAYCKKCRADYRRTKYHKDKGGDKS